MSEPRFYVRELKGRTIPVPYTPTGQNMATSFYIMDRLYNARVVATFENIGQPVQAQLSILRRRAERRCEQLTEWWRLEMRDG